MSAMSLSLGRIGAIVARNVYLLRGSRVRVLEMVFWPMMEIIFWGFFTQYLSQQTNHAVLFTANLLVGAAFLLQTLVRNQVSVFVVFMEDVWSRNLGHLAVSPLRPWEYVAGVILVAVMRISIGLMPAALVAWLLFKANLLAAGLPLVGFFAVLMVSGWVLGLLTTGIVLRHGMGAEWISWMLVFLTTPLVCAYYPVATLPPALQVVAWALPPTYVFEGMRAALLEGRFELKLLLEALGLGLLYLALAMYVAHRAYQYARVNARLLVSQE